MCSVTAGRMAKEPTGNSRFWKSSWNGLAAAIRKVHIQKKNHALRLEETLPLGERRFLAVVQWEGVKLLLGVTAHGITLLESRPYINAHASAANEDRGA